jgi:hypothetical protein
MGKREKGKVNKRDKDWEMQTEIELQRVRKDTNRQTEK